MLALRYLDGLKVTGVSKEEVIDEVQDTLKNEFSVNR